MDRLRPPCEAELLVIDGKVEYAHVLPGVLSGLERCGKPSVDRQDSLRPWFDSKFPPKALCAEHWDLYMAKLAEVRSMSPEERAAVKAEADEIVNEEDN